MPGKEDRGLHVLEQAPLPALVRSLGAAIAEAQLEMDQVSVRAIAVLADPELGVELPGETEKRSLLTLGLTPTFYHFTEATISAKVAFSLVESESFTFGAKVGAGAVTPYGMFYASVNASYTNKYSFQVEGSSEVITKIVSLPPPGPLADLLAGVKR